MLAKLAERGIDEAKIVWLEELVARARQMADAPAATGPTPEERAEERRKLLAFRGWFVEWTEMAKAVIKRRDYLIALGLASRKKAKRKKAAVKPPTE